MDLLIVIPLDNEVDFLETIFWDRWETKAKTNEVKFERKRKAPKSKIARKRDREAAVWKAVYYDI